MWVFEQLRDLRERFGYEVSVVLNGDHGTLVDRFRSAGIPVHATDFDFTSNADLLALPRKVIRLVRLLQRERFDVIQTHLFHSMVIGRIAAWFADVPVRLSMIAGPFHLEAYTPRWIDKITCWADTAIIASCEYTRWLYRRMGVPLERLECIYYGPDEAKFDPSTVAPADLHGEFGWPRDAPLIGMIAYFYPELPANRWIPPAVQGRSVKSQEDLIRAAQFVLSEFPMAKFLLIGSGWEEGGCLYMQRMQGLVAELGLEESVIFTGFRTDIPAVLRAINVAVQSSLSENLGGTIESLLMECPTVVTRVGGMVDSVLDGETGIQVDPSNPHSLAKGILRLLRDPSTGRRLAIAGRNRMLANFTLRRTVDGLAEIYRRRFAEARQGYRPRARAARLAAGSLLCLVIVLRYCLVDAWILPAWDQGWRPWRGNALSVSPGRMLLYRFYALVGRNAPSFGVRRRLKAVPSRTRHRLVYLKHMTLYRFYAFVGRHPPNFGLRQRIGTLPNRARHWLIYLKHVSLYRFYAFVGRHPPNFGLRQRIGILPNRARHWLIYLKHVSVYRLYAFVGRQCPGFGLRERVVRCKDHLARWIMGHR